MLIEQRSRILRPRWFVLFRRAVFIRMFSLPVTGGLLLVIGGKSSALARIFTHIDEAVGAVAIVAGTMLLPMMAWIIGEVYFVFLGQRITNGQESARRD